MFTPPRVGIIGCGRVGGTLAIMLQRAGWPITALASRRNASARTLMEQLAPPEPQLVDAAAVPEGAELLLLTVPDDVLPGLAGRLAPTAREGTVVCHTSGALPSAVLAPLGRRGARLLAAHPMQTIPDAATGCRLLPGTVWGLEGDPDAVTIGRQMVSALQGSWFPVAPGEKAAYHAACVLAANALVALASLASQLLGGAVDRDRNESLTALLPLLRGAVRALEERGLPGALTGPIQRGDTTIVAQHVGRLLADREPAAIGQGEQAEDWRADLPAVYGLLGREALRLAQASGNLDESEAAEMAELLARSMAGSGRFRVGGDGRDD